MEVRLSVDDVDSITGGDAELLAELLERAMMPLGLLLGRLDPDGHSWVCFVEEVKK